MNPVNEKNSRDLDRLGPRLLDLLVRHLESGRSGQGAVVRRPPLAELATELGLAGGMPAEPVSETEFLATVARYLEGSIHMHHPGFMAHQVAVPTGAAALAEMVHGATNNGMAIYEMGPAAVAVEMAVLDWMAGLAGWPKLRRPGDPDGLYTGGVLTHGGSLANLTALLAARAALAPESWEHGSSSGELCVLAAPEAHYCISRSAGIMGLGTRALRPLQVDQRQVIRPDRLAAAVAGAREQGCRIMALVASACSTGPGLYDPLDEVGSFCREEGIWFHVDAAHGAAALLSPRLRPLVKGLEKADSFVWDAHKMLRTSALCTAVLVRDSERLPAAFRQEGSYIFDDEEHPGIDLLERTVECTKAPLGVKVFFNLLLHGEEGLRRHVERQYDLARQFHETIAARPGFSCPFPPQANILCFRAPGDDARQLWLRRRLLQDGRFHLSSTAIGGRRYLRMALMGPSTDMGTLESLLQAIDDLGPPDSQALS